MASGKIFFLLAIFIACSLSFYQTTSGARLLSAASDEPVENSLFKKFPLHKHKFFKKPVLKFPPKFKVPPKVTATVPEKTTTTSEVSTSRKTSEVGVDEAKFAPIPGVPSFDITPILNMPYPDLPLVPAMPFTPQTP